MHELQVLTLSSVVAAFISTFYFALIWRLNRKIAGINYWLIAVILQPISWLLLALRGNIPDFLTYVVANYAAVMSVLLFAIGARRFYGYNRHNTKYIVGISLVFIPAMLYWWLISPSTGIRIQFVFGTANVIMIGAIINALKHKSARFSLAGRVYIGFCALLIGLICLRMSSGWLELDTQSMFQLSFSNLVGALLGFIMPYGMTLTILLLCNERRVTQIDTLRQNAAQEAKIKNRYLATLSHELRTPLNGMIGKAQLLQQRQTQTQDIADCQTIVIAGRELANLASEVLEYASLVDSDKVAVNSANINLVNFVDSIVSLMRPLAEEKQLEFTCTISPELPEYVQLDQGKVRQVLLNLLANAIKYTDEGKINLSVIHQSDSLRFSIKDTGIGIPENEHELLLNPFVTASNRDARIEGTGFGLALSQQLLLALNSQLCFTSKENQGSEFFFNIPLVKVSVPASATANVTDADIITGLNILLVEDIALNQEIATALLSIDGHTVTLAADAASAIHHLQHADFDLILLDMQLPDMNGVALYKQLTSSSILPDKTRVIPLTATITQHDLANYRILGLHTILEKPLELSVLRQTLSETFGNAPTNAKISVAQSSAHIALDFDPSVFAFLENNLNSTQLVDAINELPHSIEHYLNEIENVLHEGRSVAQHIHKLTGLSAQFGLEQFTHALRSHSREQHKLTSSDLSDLRAIAAKGIYALNQYSNQQLQGANFF